ncbi:ABC transporter permease [Dyella sedimenti]|uniref:ABC transporter permease n=1 Tax=Dyella sedimenti TaxID=2919947 RepID=UPI001FAAE966|nr:ABC transporter permease [Dyella sedimenti]
MRLLVLAFKSMRQRRYAVALTVLTIALSVLLLLGVDRLRRQAHSSFASTVSGTDLIVGARSGPVNLLLYAIFHVGDATSNVSWQSYQEIAALPEVAWTVPISLGDSHRGFRVMGTTTAFFDRYRYGAGNRLGFAEGAPFGDLYDAVIGAQVARRLHYRLGQSIVIAHGFGGMRQMLHADKPFRVVGILAPTGTPVDGTVMVSLAGIEAIHVDWRSGMRLPGMQISAAQARTMNLTPTSITAFMVGLKSRLATFAVQRAVNDYTAEPLLAILPGVALDQLWNLVGAAENTLRAVSAMVVLVGLCGMLTALLTMLDERRREMAILRAVGAPAHAVFLLLLSESALLAIAGIVLGVALLYAMLAVVRGVVQERLGIMLTLSPPAPGEWLLMGAVLVMALLAGCLPAWIAYRRSLADGLRMRL